MSDFAGHSRAGIRSFFVVSILIIPILVWRESGETMALLKNLWKLPVCLIITYLGALFPDIDIKSTSQKIIYLIIFVFLILLTICQYYGWATGIGILAVFGILFKHRGFLHSRTAAFLIPLPLLFIPLFVRLEWRQLGFEFYLSAVTGYLSHLKADEVSKDKKTKSSIKQTRIQKECTLAKSTN